MKKIYTWVALLAIYGDLLKRVLPPQLAVALLYVLAVAILMTIILSRRRPKNISRKLSKEGSIICMMSIVLVFLYAFQSLTFYSINFMDGFMLAIYVSTPLLFIIIFTKFYSDFDLGKLANPFLWMMIPVNIVGFIQYFIYPEFIVSSTYSEEGGVIYRNFLKEGAFTRYPSIFASADRYSAMALMQFYFTVVLLNNVEQRKSKRLQWIAFNLGSAILALGIAGARSRILILFVVLVLALLTYFIGIKSIKKMQKTLIAGALVLVLIVIFSLAFLFDPQLGNKFIESFSILNMLGQTFETGDVATRTSEGIILSMFPDDITLFGVGLGSESPGGRPGEFAIRAIWKESGLIFGVMMILAFVGMILMLCRLTFFAFRKGLATQVVMCSIPLMLMVFALLAGLTSAFELSSGILLGCAIADISQKKTVIFNAGVNQDKLKGDA